MKLMFSIGASFLLSTGFADEVAPGFQVETSLRTKVFSVALETRVLIPARTFARDRIDAGNPSAYPEKFDISELAANLVPCVRWKFLAGCGVVQGGVLFNDGASPGLMTERQFALGPRGGVDFLFYHSFALFAFAEALFVPDPRSFSYANGNVRWNQPVATAFFGAGAAVLFK
jgi:hypothetical protein